MPFDNPATRVDVEVQNREEIAILDGMARRLATPDLWCKYSLRSGHSHCIAGALNEEDHGDHDYLWYDKGGVQFSAASRHVYDRLNDLAGPQRNRTRSDQAVDFNNAESTTHADILGLIQRARRSFE